MKSDLPPKANINQSQKPAPRIPLEIEVEYRKSYGRNSATGQLKNVSLTGAFIKHFEHALSCDDKISLNFNVGGRMRNISAVVIWSSKSGAGVKFLPTTNRDVQIIDDLIYFVESKRQNRRGVIDEIFKRAA
jgi:hypothetical protein